MFIHNFTMAMAMATAITLKLGLKAVPGFYFFSGKKGKKGMKKKKLVLEKTDLFRRSEATRPRRTRTPSPRASLQPNKGSYTLSD